MKTLMIHKSNKRYILHQMHSEIKYRRNYKPNINRQLINFSLVILFTFGRTVHIPNTVTHTRAIGVTRFILLGDTSAVQSAVYIRSIKWTLI